MTNGLSGTVAKCDCKRHTPLPLALNKTLRSRLNGENCKGTGTDPSSAVTVSAWPLSIGMLPVVGAGSVVSGMAGEFVEAESPPPPQATKKRLANKGLSLKSLAMCTLELLPGYHAIGCEPVHPDHHSINGQLCHSPPSRSQRADARAQGQAWCCGSARKRGLAPPHKAAPRQMPATPRHRTFSLSWPSTQKPPQDLPHHPGTQPARLHPHKPPSRCRGGVGPGSSPVGAFIVQQHHALHVRRL